MGEVFGWIAVVTGIRASWPQVARIVIRKDDTGVSVLARRLAVLSTVTWVGIGTVNEIPSTITFNALALLGALSVLFVIARLHQRSLLPDVYVVVCAIALCLLAYFAFGDLGVEVLGTAFGMSIMVPQVWKAARMKHIPGVSPIAWSLALVCNVSWLIFGVTINEWVLIYPTGLLIGASAFIFYRSYKSDRNLRRSEPELAPVVTTTGA